MATIHHDLTIEAAPSQVFEHLTDPEKSTIWQASLLEVRLTPEGPMQPGTRITEVRKILGRRMESTVEVTELEPPRVYAGRVLSGPVPWEFRYTLDAADGSTRMRFHLEGEPGGFFLLAEPIVVRTVEKQLAGDFSTLKDLLESR